MADKKELKEILEDAQDGRIKKKNIEKLKDIVEDKPKPVQKAMAVDEVAEAQKMGKTVGAYRKWLRQQNK